MLGTVRATYRTSFPSSKPAPDAIATARTYAPSARGSPRPRDAPAPLRVMILVVEFPRPATLGEPCHVPAQPLRATLLFSALAAGETTAAPARCAVQAGHICSSRAPS